MFELCLQFSPFFVSIPDILLCTLHRLEFRCRSEPCSSEGIMFPLSTRRGPLYIVRPDVRTDNAAAAEFERDMFRSESDAPIGALVKAARDRG